MAYRGGAGLWIAIAVLGVLTVFFGALYFQRESRIDAVQKAIQNDSYQQLANRGKWNNASVRSLIQEREDLAKERDRLRNMILDRDDKIDAQRAALDERDERAKDLDAENRTLQARIENLKTTNDQLQQKFKDVREERREDLEGQIQQLQENYQNQQIRSENLLHKVTRMRELQEALRKAYQRRVIELQRENHALRKVIEKFEKETRGREEIMKEQHDGRIIQVDIDNKFIVVDLGRAHKVHRGMRFDVIRWRLNRWDYMGSIQLTKVGTTTSQGVIVDAIVQERVCPVTGWVAPNREMRYSPYAAGGPDGNRVVPLVKTDTKEKPSMRKLDPIVIGDYITNPFYSKKRVLKFVIAGESVRYSTNEMRQQIQEYGAVLQPEVDVDTDYLVLGRIPEEGAIAGMEAAESRKMRDRAIAARETAKQYGIPIMREVELFHFLHH